jgi:TetR/AcrR family transcriptional repressor of uid operon
MPKQERARATRQAIVEAAGVVFARSSYASAKLSEIITEAGVTQGALYFHFESKHALALELILQQHQLCVDAGARLLSDDMPGAEGLVRLTHTFAQQLRTLPIVQAGIRLSTESAGYFPEHARAPYEFWIAQSAEHLRKAIAEGDVSPRIGVDSIARFVVESFTGTQMVSAVFDDWARLDNRITNMWDIIFAAIGCPDSRDHLLAVPRLVHGDGAPPSI